jgi:hypothetical protein
VYKKYCYCPTHTDKNSRFLKPKFLQKGNNWGNEFFFFPAAKFFFWNDRKVLQRVVGNTVLYYLQGAKFLQLKRKFCLHISKTCFLEDCGLALSILPAFVPVVSNAGTCTAFINTSYSISRVRRCVLHTLLTLHKQFRSRDYTSGAWP